MRGPFFLIFAILITACAAPTSVPPTATLTPMTPIATLEPSPTATPPAPTEWAVVPTATPESLPADVLAVLKDQKYTMADTNGDGYEDIVAESGETLFRYVLEADRVNPESEWQRMITFTLEGGDKMEMARFDTPEEAYDYMVKVGILWKASWGTKDLENTQEKIDFLENLFKIPEIDGKIMGGMFPNNKDNSSRTHIMVYSAGDSTIVLFLTDEDILQATYTAQSAEDILQAIYTAQGVTELYFWMDQK